jgi:hypothetical protein
VVVAKSSHTRVDAEAEVTNAKKAQNTTQQESNLCIFMGGNSDAI